MEKTNINLVILSPSSEVNKLTFSSIPTTTTIGELRERITAAVVTHPAPGRQRLIYRGHALLDPTRTLKDIFTQEIINNSESLSLHLVLPPEPAVAPGTSSTTSNIPSHDPRAQSPQNMRENPILERNAQYHPQGVEHPSGQAHTGQSNVPPPQPPAEPGQTPHIHVHGTLPNGQFPPQLQQAFAQFQAVNAQLAAQLVAVGANPGYQGVGPHQAQAPTFQQPPFGQPPLQHMFAQQQQQARTASEPPASSNNLQQPFPAGTPVAQGNGQGIGRSPTPRNTNTFVRENRGPNGERWQMVIQSGPVNVNTTHTVPTHSNEQFHLAAPSIPRRGSPTAQGSHGSQGSTPPVELMYLQSHLSAMETAMAAGNPLPDSVFEQAREMLMGIPDMPQEGRSNMSTRLNSLAGRANNLRETLNNHLSRAAQERAAAQRAVQGPQSSAVYVLSSPSGPQALLISPTGLYSAPWQSSGLGFVSPSSFVQHHPQELQTQVRTSSLQNTIGAQQPANAAVQAQQAVPQNADGAPVEQVQPQAQQQQQQQQVNQARDILRILLPLGGNLWLLVRLFGFVYFFIAGAGWRRTILLGLAACLVFVAQTGIFRPVLQAIWDPIRRHAEGLVPLAGNEPHRAGVARAGDNANAAATQRTDQEPTPHDAAERLLQERERRDVSFLRQSIRRVERAIALFVASLVPGVGERHIAARGAAEAARQAEAREREEQARREDAEARRQQEENMPEAAGTQGNANIAGEAAQIPTAPEQRPNAPPPPLVEV